MPRFDIGSRPPAKFGLSEGMVIAVGPAQSKGDTYQTSLGLLRDWLLEEASTDTPSASGDSVTIEAAEETSMLWAMFFG